MQPYLERYVREELTDSNAVHRALRKSSCEYRFLPLTDHDLGKAAVWPELLAQGTIENAASLKFMMALRQSAQSSGRGRPSTTSSPKRSASPRSSSATQHRRRVLSAHQRPNWNSDTRHIDMGVDPLRKCLQETLKRKGFERDFSSAKQSVAVEQAREVERLKQEAERQQILQRQAEIQRELASRLAEFTSVERKSREVIVRGERNIRAKVENEFRRTQWIVAELTEFNARKRLFKLALQQLDELKILEREDFHERQLYEKLVQQQAIDQLRQQKELQWRKTRTEEFKKKYYSLTLEEITERDKLVQWMVQKLVQYENLEHLERERLLRKEILISVVAEEQLQRRILFEARDNDMRQLRMMQVVDKATLQEELDQVQLSASRQRHETQMREAEARRAQEILDFFRTETIARSDVSSSFASSSARLGIQFRLQIQVLRLTDKERSERLALERSSIKSLQTLLGDASHKANALLTEHRQTQAAAVQRARALRSKAETENRPFLGVTLAEHTSGAAQLVVESLYIDGPADAAGVRVGDVIIAVGERPVTTFAEMREAVKASAKMGQYLPMTALREATRLDILVRVMTADKEYASLTDIYFDIEKHARVSKQNSTHGATSLGGSPQSTASSSPARPPSRTPSKDRRTP